MAAALDKFRLRLLGCIGILMGFDINFSTSLGKPLSSGPKSKVSPILYFISLYRLWAVGMVAKIRLISWVFIYSSKEEYTWTIDRSE